MWHEYISAATLQEAKQVLAQRRETARVVAGATDLILELERGLRPGVSTLVKSQKMSPSIRARRSTITPLSGPATVSST